MNKKETIQKIENKIIHMPTIRITLNEMTTYAEESIQKHENSINKLNKQLAKLNNKIDQQPDNLQFKIDKIDIIIQKATSEKAILFHKTIINENIELQDILSSIEKKCLELDTLNDEDIENLYNTLNELCSEYVKEYNF